MSQHVCLCHASKPPALPRAPVIVVTVLVVTILEIRSFEKGLADRGGWREKTLQRPEI